MRVKNLTLLILLFKVFSLLCAVTAETNVSISSNASESNVKQQQDVNGTNLSGNRTQHLETGSLSSANRTTTVESYSNSTSHSDVGIIRLLKDNNGAVLRAFYVVVGVTAIVVCYFVIRSYRLRKKRSKTRKYGITGKNIDLEMTPLDQEDDDDDLTVFEVPKHSKR